MNGLNTVPNNHIPNIKPVYFLADSRLLFTPLGGRPFLETVISDKPAEQIKAVYIGVANDDEPVFYEMFVAAMRTVSVHNCYQITRQFPSEQRKHLEDADIILLGGGDVASGWRVMTETGMNEIITRRYYEGAAIIGVSAGAVQLGLFGADREHNFFETLKLAPFIIDVHQENNNWDNLQFLLDARNEHLTGIGIPSGAGLIYHPDHSLEALAKPLHEFRVAGEHLTDQLIFPGKRFVQS